MENELLIVELKSDLAWAVAALDACLERRPMHGAVVANVGEGSNTVGNIRAELGKYRRD